MHQLQPDGGQVAGILKEALQLSEFRNLLNISFVALPERVEMRFSL